MEIEARCLLHLKPDTVFFTVFYLQNQYLVQRMFSVVMGKPGFVTRGLLSEQPLLEDNSPFSLLSCSCTIRFLS